MLELEPIDPLSRVNAIALCELYHRAGMGCRLFVRGGNGRTFVRRPAERGPTLTRLAPSVFYARKGVPRKDTFLKSTTIPATADIACEKAGQ